MQRALIAGIVLALLLAFLGIFVILRKMAFWGEGIAHASLAGIAIGLLVSYNPLITAIIFAIIFAILVYVLERKTSLSGDVDCTGCIVTDWYFSYLQSHRRCIAIRY